MRGSGRSGRTAARCATLALTAALATTTVVAAPRAAEGPGRDGPARAAADGSVGLVVTGQAGVTGAAAAVSRHGGAVTRALPIVDGVAARVPARAVQALAADPAVRAVSPDAKLRVQSTTSGAQAAAASPASVHRAEVRSDAAAAAGARGQGVTVALLDTGVTPGGDLSGRLVDVRDDLTGAVDTCVNLSGESTCNDTYGHGTFLAGLIAGSGAASSGRYQGAAPQAKVVSIKVGGADGSADVSAVLSGIQWAVSYKQQYGIRVLNLSLGTDSTQSWTTDPLNYAVERAWQSGLVVVVAVSNRGPAARTISKPADDPWVISVGAVDDRGTKPIADDALPVFTGRGPSHEGVAKPDVVAPGGHLVSLNAAGSTLAREHPSSMAAPYRLASGTSMSAAVVSGVAAQVLSARPTLTPDRLKYLLSATARPVASDARTDVGSGIVDAYAALKSNQAGVANVGLARSTGRGSLAASRGHMLVETRSLVPVVLDGVYTAQLVVWDPLGFTTGDWTAATWTAAPVRALPWSPTRWYGWKWEGWKWEGASWYGQPVHSGSYGSRGEGSAWYGAWG